MSFWKKLFGIKDKSVSVSESPVLDTHAEESPVKAPLVCAVPEDGDNTGLIAPEVRPLDFIAGEETGVVFQSRLSDGDWERFLPTHEWQRKLPSGYDTMSCVTFSALNCVEAQINYLLATGQIPEDKKIKMSQLGYLDENGKVNFNDWFTAVMSGTTTAGNALQPVWDSIRKHGLLAQKDGFQVSDFSNINDWLDRGRITEAHKEKALKFLELFDVAYEWVILNEEGVWEKFRTHLQQAPLHVATPTCGSWNNNGIVTNCGDYRRLNHATSIIGLAWNSFYKDLDHYVPFIKKLAWDYYVPFAIKGVVSVKASPVVVTPPAIKFKWTRSLKVGMSGYDVVMLQKVLLAEVPETFKASATGYFGEWTLRGVKALQTRYKAEILAPVGLNTATGFVGASTLKWLNTRFA